MAITAWSDLSGTPKSWDSRKDLFTTIVASGTHPATVGNAIARDIDTGTSARQIAQWNSQTGGTYNLTQVSSPVGTGVCGSASPYFVGGNRGSPFPHVEFNPSAITGGTQGMGVPTGPSGWSNRSCSALFVLDMPNYQETNARLFATGAGGVNSSLNLKLGLLSVTDGGAQASWPQPTIRIPTNRQVLVVRFDAADGGNMTVWTGRNRSGSAVLNAAVGSSATNFSVGGNTSGMPTASNGFWGGMYLAVIAMARWTDTEVQDAIAFAGSEWDIDTAPAYNFVVLGDSMSSSGPVAGGGGGFSVINNVTWPRLFSNMLDGGGRHSLHNCATSSLTAATALSSFSTRCTPAFQSDAKNIFIMMIGTNDLNGGQTAALLKDDIVSLVNAARNAGAWKVVVANIPPRTGIPATRTTFNTDIAANYASWGIDVFVDAASATPATSVKSSPDTNTQFFVDGTHMTPEGMGLLADKFLRTVQPLLTTSYAGLRNRY